MTLQKVVFKNSIFFCQNKLIELGVPLLNDLKSGSINIASNKVSFYMVVHSSRKLKKNMDKKEIYTR